MLEKLVLVKFANDTVVDPRGTEWFDYYAPGQSEVIVPLRESALYKVHYIFWKINLYFT